MLVWLSQDRQHRSRWVGRRAAFVPRHGIVGDKYGEADSAAKEASDKVQWFADGVVSLEVTE